MKKMIYIFLGLILIIVFWVFRGFIFQKTQPTPELTSLKNIDFKIIAHRGASGVAPENTFSAFNKALELGVDMIELDVHLTKDNQVIVIHDELLDRTTSGTGYIKDFDYKELENLDAGSWFSEQFNKEKIPLLDTVLSKIKGEATVLIEIKRGKKFVYDGMAEALIDIIRKHNAEKWCIVQSFEKSYIEKMYQQAPDLEYYLLIVTDLEPILPYYADNYFSLKKYEKAPFYKAINPASEFLSVDRIKSIQKEGLKVFTYTVNETDQMRKIIKMGVNGIITNYPEKLIQIRNQLNN